MGLVDISAPALLYRLRQSGDWLTFLIDHVFALGGRPGKPAAVV